MLLLVRYSSLVPAGDEDGGGQRGLEGGPPRAELSSASRPVRRSRHEGDSERRASYVAMRSLLHPR